MTRDESGRLSRSLGSKAENHLAANYQPIRELSTNAPFWLVVLIRSPDVVSGHASAISAAATRAAELTQKAAPSPCRAESAPTTQGAGALRPRPTFQVTPRARPRDRIGKSLAVRIAKPEK